MTFMTCMTYMTSNTVTNIRFRFMRPIQMVDTKTQYQKIKPEVDSAVLQVMESSAFINGKAVQDFAANLSLISELSIRFPVPMEQMLCR